MKLVLAFLALVLAPAAFAQTVTLNVTPATAVGSATPVATWSTSPAATSCAASGGWTGNKAASGTQTLAAISANASYTLTCTFGVGGTATASWDAPTHNTDGSPYTDGAGYLVLYGQSPSNLTQSVTVNSPTVTSRDFTGLAPGTWYFATRAFNTAGRQSDTSTVANTVVAAAVTRAATAGVVITAPPPTTPNPPSNMRAIGTQVFTLTMIGRDIMLGGEVGTVTLGQPCGPVSVYGSYRTVARADVTLRTTVPNGAVLVARCG
jgi:hypothetical protein